MSKKREKYYEKRVSNEERMELSKRIMQERKLQ